MEWQQFVVDLVSTYLADTIMKVYQIRSFTTYRSGKPLPPDLLCLDIETSTWSIVDFHGTQPSGRNFHTMVYYDNSLYIFGGKSHGYQNDLHQFSLVTNTWTKLGLDRKTRPARRYGHTAVVHNDSMYILGGISGVFRG
jgi:hypothetical protein